MTAAATNTLELSRRMPVRGMPVRDAGRRGPLNRLIPLVLLMPDIGVLT